MVVFLIVLIFILNASLQAACFKKAGSEPCSRKVILSLFGDAFSSVLSTGFFLRSLDDDLRSVFWNLIRSVFIWKRYILNQGRYCEPHRDVAIPFFRIILLVLTLFISPIAFALPYDRAIVFGDSLSDIGNNKWANHSNATNSIVGAPVTNFVDGKPGKLWIQNLVQDPTLFSNNEVHPSSENPGTFTGSADYAWASAITKAVYVNIFGVVQPTCTAPGKFGKTLCVPGVLLQVQSYLDYLKKLHEDPDPSTLYIFWAGGNDIFDNAVFVHNIALKQQTYAELKSSFSLHPVNNLMKAAEMLIKAGVPSSHIAIINLPNLTKAPLAYRTLKGHPLLAFMSKMSVVQFNRNLFIQLKLAHLFHGYNIQEINVYPLLQQVANDPQKYGFTHMEEQCDDNPEALKAGCPGYVFYNEKHPSTQAGVLIAKDIAKQIHGRD